MSTVTSDVRILWIRSMTSRIAALAKMKPGTTVSTLAREAGSIARLLWARSAQFSRPSSACRSRGRSRSLGGSRSR
jgi:hypothetical protein